MEQVYEQRGCGPRNELKIDRPEVAPLADLSTVGAAAFFVWSKHCTEKIPLDSKSHVCVSRRPVTILVV